MGARASEKLINNSDDLVVGLPDLYPNHEYSGTEFKHDNFEELKAVQADLLRKSLEKHFGIPKSKQKSFIDRFLPSAFKYDSEMLLLAARNELRQVLNTTDHIGNWRHPVENQNQDHPPKYIVDGLFKTRLGIAYRDTVHAKTVLEKVNDMRTILYRDGNQLQCPVFKEMLDWIGSKSGIPAY